MSKRNRLALLVFLFPAIGYAQIGVTTETLELVFDGSGNLQSAVACYPQCQPESGRQDVAKRIQFGSGAPSFLEPGLGGAVRLMDHGSEAGIRLLQFESDTGARLTWRVPGTGYVIEAERTGVTGDTPFRIDAGADFRPRPLAGFGGWLERTRYIALESDAKFAGASLPLDGELESPWQSAGWTGFRNRYWAFMMQPSRAVDIVPQTGPEQSDARLGIQPGTDAVQFSFYLGPVEARSLADADPQLKQIMFGALWFWLRWICFGLLAIITVIHDALATFMSPGWSWGIAIMGLSLAVNLLMRPLTKIADRLQDGVHEVERRLAPGLEDIKSRHKGEEQTKQILALYQSEGVHPLYSLKSLMGVAIVIPVFIGAFDMLAENIHLLDVSFLWIRDLSRPDAIATLPFEVPFFGAQVNLLPFLMTGLSMVSSSLHRSPSQHPQLRKKQNRNMYLLALAFFVLFYTFPSGMVLYWTTNNLISAVKGGFRRLRAPSDHEELGQQ